MNRNRLGRFAGTALISVLCAAGAIAIAAAMTLVLSFAVCLGADPQAARMAEWSASIAGVVWAGALARRRGIGASIGTGLVVGLVWALTWFYLIGRFDTNLWVNEGLPSVSRPYITGWLAAPALGLLGGASATRLRKRRPSRILTWAVPPAFVLLVMFFNNACLVEAPGKYALANGASVAVSAPDSEGTIVRLFAFNFRANPRLRIGLYDCDSDDSRPYDDINTSYYGTPASSVFDKRGPNALCVVNAGFFTWTKTGRIGSHVAPIVQSGRAHYNVLDRPDVWTFGWTGKDGLPVFSLTQQTPFQQLAKRFDTAIVHVRPLVVNGGALTLKPGAGVTRLKCSRSSLAWSEDSSKLYLLVVVDPDGEMASSLKWKSGQKQVGGWDLPQVQRFWMKMGMKQALALDGGDSTQVVYKDPRGTTADTSGRLAYTFGYWRNRPVRLWAPILPMRNNNTGVMNYLYVERTW